jgi:hypothetical protein
LSALHFIAISQQDFTADPSGEIEKNISRANQHVGRLEQDIALTE